MKEKEAKAKQEPKEKKRLSSFSIIIILLFIVAAVTWFIPDVSSAKLSDILNSSRGEISNRETTIEWNCFPVMGRQVDKAAKALLQDITGVEVKPSEESGKIMKYNSFRESGVAYTDKRGKTENTAFLDSKNYKYGVMDENSASAKIEALVQAIGTDEEAIEPF